MFNSTKFMPNGNDIVMWFFRDTLLKSLLPSIVLVILGLPIVFIALLWIKYKPVKSHIKESLGPQYEGWRYVRLPKLFWLWDNTEVGAMGDHTRPSNVPFGVKPDSFLAMYDWLAIRNPVNNLKQLIGYAPTPHYVAQYCGDYAVDSTAPYASAGWQFVKVTDGTKTYYGLSIVIKLFKGYCSRIRMGFKIKPNMDLMWYTNTGATIGTCCVITPIKKFN